jgi:hypothetical protein
LISSRVGLRSIRAPVEVPFSLVDLIGINSWSERRVTGYTTLLTLAVTDESVSWSLSIVEPVGRLSEAIV